MKKSITRRQFIRANVSLALAAGVIPTIVPASALGRAGKVAPNNRIIVGCIGVGPQGRGVMNGFLTQAGAQVVAVCDVKRDQLELARTQVNARYQNTDCATFDDFREVLARKDLDAVLIATPDHWHIHIAVAAARAGKDMYLEKPMGLTLAEDQLLRRVVQRNKCIFQFGTQQRSSREFQRACELVRSGAIGQLQQINVWCAASRPGGATTPIPVPDTINYDQWLGPAPFTPYTEDKCSDDGNKKTWWFNYDYALGFIAGWGVHPLDIALWGHPAMMRGAMEIEGKAIIPTEGACNTSVAWNVDFTFADGVRMNFRGTRNQFKEVNEMNDLSAFQAKYGQLADHGTAFEGTEGWVLVHRGMLRTHPEHLAEAATPAEHQLRRSSNHVGNFLDGVRHREPAVCGIETAVEADMLCHLSDIATRVNRKLRFDPRREKFPNDEDANRRLALRPMRPPWQLG
ncbi:MAG: Gfo/Idh/MocA family oxidoreductase [Verrucomicrobia bacterium]|nr:Gfo/Idh/MocA family oxidoreductase [Verrucomicrobiota bacterium]